MTAYFKYKSISSSNALRWNSDGFSGLERYAFKRETVFLISAQQPEAAFTY